MQDFGEFETPIAHHLGVLLLVSSQSLDPLFGGRGRSMFDKSPKELSAGDGHDIDVVPENGLISGRDRERNLSESRVKRFNADDGILLVVKSQSAQQTVDLDIRIARPDTDVVTVLVADTGPLNVEFHVDTVPVRVEAEELTSDGDGSCVGVLGVVDTLGPCQSTRRKFTYEDFVNI